MCRVSSDPSSLCLAELVLENSTEGTVQIVSGNSPDQRGAKSRAAHHSDRSGRGGSRSCGSRNHAASSSIGALALRSPAAAKVRRIGDMAVTSLTGRTPEISRAPVAASSARRQRSRRTGLRQQARSARARQGVLKYPCVNSPVPRSDRRRIRSMWSTHANSSRTDCHMPDKGPYQLCLPKRNSASGASGKAAGLSVGLSALTLISLRPSTSFSYMTSKENGRTASCSPTGTPLTQTRGPMEHSPETQESAPLAPAGGNGDPATINPGTLLHPQIVKLCLPGPGPWIRLISTGRWLASGLV